MTFRIGQKVVCISDEWRNPQYELPVAMPMKHGVYTIRAMGLGTCGDNGEEQIGLLFQEFIYPIASCGFEPSFSSRCFRPIVERKTDISIFQKMLESKKVEA